MMTWFDAILVTLLALVTALGARRGLAGAAWGLGAVAVCFVSNLLSGVPALLLALLLGAGLVWLSHQLSQRLGHEIPLWQSWIGGLGGLAFGLVFVCSLALGFPLRQQDNTQSYPSSEALPAPLYKALKYSYIQSSLQNVWIKNSRIQTLLVPDQVRRPK